MSRSQRRVRSRAPKPQPSFARSAALATLRSELHAELPRTDMALIGLPEQPLAVALLDRLAGALALA